MNAFLPISPILTKDGSLLALVNLLGEEGAKPVPLANRNAALNSFNVVSDSVSYALAAKLGIGSIFNGAVTAKDKGFYFDAMAFTEEYSQTTLPDQTVYATRWGVGIRVALHVIDNTGNVNLNFGNIAAAVQLQQASAQYEITGIGLGIDGLSIVLGQLSSIGDFTYETYQAITKNIVKALSDYIQKNKATLIPQPVAVAIAPPLDLLTDAQAIYYTMKCIADRDTLGDALKNAPPKLDRDKIRETYIEITNSDDPSSTPSRDAEHLAENWLNP